MNNGKVKTILRTVKKQNWELAAEIKTISDYALILEYANGYEKRDAQKFAAESHGEELFEALHKRNKTLFLSGDVVMFGNS
jgi:hypothetical protein